MKRWKHTEPGCLVFDSLLTPPQSHVHFHIFIQYPESLIKGRTQLRELRNSCVPSPPAPRPARAPARATHPASHPPHPLHPTPPPPASHPHPSLPPSGTAGLLHLCYLSCAAVDVGVPPSRSGVQVKPVRTGLVRFSSAPINPPQRTKLIQFIPLPPPPPPTPSALN